MKITPFLCLGFLTISVQGQVVVAPNYGALFIDIKTYQESAISLAKNDFDLQKINRRILESKYGMAGVGKLFPNGINLDPSIQGLDKTLRLAASGNANQARGYCRNILYANGFSEGRKFTVVGTDVDKVTPLGKTDVDIMLRHNDTGRPVNIEVKDQRMDTQNIDDYKLKINKKAWISQNTGSTEAIMNRYALKPEIKEYATQKGVKTYENVRTGKADSFKGEMAFQAVEADLHNKCSIRSTSPVRVVGGAIEGGLGVYMLYTETPKFISSINDMQVDAYSTQSLLRFVESGGLMTTGTGMTMSFVGSIWGNSQLNKIGGKLGFAGLILAEGAMITNYCYGGMNNREFWSKQANIGGGFAGAWVGGQAGAWIGGEIGALLTPQFGGTGAVVGAPIGGLIGSVAGAFGGSTIGSKLAEGYYSTLDESQKMSVRDSVYSYYGAN